MIGKITFDKSSQDTTLLLYSVYIIGKYGNNVGIRRNFYVPCFVEIMAGFTGTDAYFQEEGTTKEKRTIYNKSLYAQYFGFIERRTIDNKEVMCLTKRGRLLYNIIDCDEANRKCFIKDGCQEIFQDLIWSSIVYDSFGKNNDGAQQSKTDIDAPKVIFRVIFDLGYATNEEICYVLYSLNHGADGNLRINKTYEDLLNEIQENRRNNSYDYSDFFNNNGLSNKVDDAKVIDIFVDPALSILTKQRRNGLTFNYLSDNCQRFLNDKNLFKCWYCPHTLILHSNSLEATKKWLGQTMLNKTTDFSKLLNISDFDNLEIAKSEIRKCLAETIKVARRKNDCNNAYFIICSNREQELFDAFCDFVPLLKRIDNYTSINHGESETRIMYNNSELSFPANFHFVSIITQ